MLDEHRTLIHAGAARGARPQRVVQDGAAEQRPLAAVLLHGAGHPVGRDPRRLEVAGQIMQRARVVIARGPHGWRRVLDRVRGVRRLRITTGKVLVRMVAHVSDQRLR